VEEKFHSQHSSNGNVREGEGSNDPVHVHVSKVKVSMSKIPSSHWISFEISTNDFEACLSEEKYPSVNRS